MQSIIHWITLDRGTMFNLFGKKKEKPAGSISQFAQAVMDMLGCPCEHFPKGSSIEVIMSAYNEAFAKREMGGYTPLIIVADDTLIEVIGEFANTRDELRINHDKLLNSEQIDAHKWFVERLGLDKESYGDDWKEIVGNIEKNPADAINVFLGIEAYGTNKSEECILAMIPTENPWEVFAWLPFGGWNECPMPEEILWIAKYWYEKHGAIPAVMTRDILEFRASPIKNEKTAADLALEQFAFCTDIVLQGLDTIGRLAGALMQSSSWYFWWD